MYRKPKKTHKTKEDYAKFVQNYMQKKKTELCLNWVTTGSCKFGDHCSFAHGENQLKKKDNLTTQYKMKPCKHFIEEMYCPYGSRCVFSHKDPNNFDKYTYTTILKNNEELIKKKVGQDINFEKLLDDEMINYCSEIKRNRLDAFTSLSKGI